MDPRMTTWTPEPINLLEIPLLTESLLEILTESGVIILVTDRGDLWNEEPLPTDTWRRRLG
jgi:hypothetical protein